MFTNEGDYHLRLRRLVAEGVHAARRGRDPRHRAGDGRRELRRDARPTVVVTWSRPHSRCPLRVICRLIGVPDEDVEIFVDWADALSATFGFLTPEQAEAATNALGLLNGYVEGLLAARRDQPARRPGQRARARGDRRRPAHPRRGAHDGRQPDRRRPRHDRQPNRLLVPHAAPQRRRGRAARRIGRSWSRTRSRRRCASSPASPRSRGRRPKTSTSSGVIAAGRLDDPPVDRRGEPRAGCVERARCASGCRASRSPAYPG